MLASQTESTWAQEVENVVVLVSIWEDDEGLVRKVALLEGELAEGRQAREVAKENFCSLSDASPDGARRLVVSEMERWEQFEELSLLWALDAELCLTIISPSQVRSFLIVRMQVTALHHTGVVRDLTTHRAAVSTAMELVLGHSPNETSMVEVMSVLTT
jgi:hypothetical protein